MRILLSTIIQICRRRRIFFLSLVLLAVLLPVSVSARAVQSLPSISREGILDGVKIDNRQLQGKIVLVNFFATWCPPCREELPSLVKLQEEFGARGFTVLGISADESVRVVLKLIKKAAINYPVIMADYQLNKDFGGISSIPVSFLVDDQGRVVNLYRGYTSHGVLQKDIARLLRR